MGAISNYTGQQIYTETVLAKSTREVPQGAGTQFHLLKAVLATSFSEPQFPYSYKWLHGVDRKTYTIHLAQCLACVKRVFVS